MLIAKITDFVCEARWGIWLFIEKLRAPGDAGRNENALRKRRIFLKTSLEANPSWAMGHVRLAWAELALREISQGPFDVRAVAVIRVSAQAAQRLSAIVGSSAISCCAVRARSESLVLSGITAFLERDLSRAASLLTDALKPENSMQLSQFALDQAKNYSDLASKVILP